MLRLNSQRPNPFQLPQASYLSMDMDHPDQDADRATAQDQQTELVILLVVPPLFPPLGLQSTTNPNSPPMRPSPHRQTPSYAPIGSGTSTTIPCASDTVALAAIREHAQKVLQAVVKASTHFEQIRPIGPTIQSSRHL